MPGSKLRQQILRLLLACALLLTQALLSVHGVEHLGHVDEDACEVCLTAAPLGAALATSPPAIRARGDLPPTSPSALTRPALPAPVNPHPVRAPPDAQPH